MTSPSWSCSSVTWACLNAPFVARCFMTRRKDNTKWLVEWSLSAPFGARCFMTWATIRSSRSSRPTGLNAPFGAWCFMAAATSRRR
ncbi:hypothetical protein HMPREF0970_00527 [Schaalia odontolytica F0309]|uniref:Uncharacterized protein n=1 Tax=Schaalia odontolytica F0309 TaxID=649742 RepID=D4TX70_9ACTO|nr:hypothetical protein HMPREF0970_00527 [Schaalia odontolytica F0309]